MEAMGVGDTAVGRVLGGFRVEELLGRGGMGVVYRATQLSLDRDVALKVVAPELAADDRFRSRFVREARMAASLEHPHLLPVYEAGEDDGVVFLAMRLVEGESLAELVARERRVPLDRAVRLVAQAAEALQVAHAAGLVHRDVKPANVLVAHVGGREHAYLCDFGLSRRVSGGSALTRPEGFVGSAAYSAPEQIRGDVVDGRADVYALGCVLFECLTGRRPFERDDELALMWAHMHEAPPRPSELDPSLAAFDDVVADALAKEPDERPPAAEFARLVQSVDTSPRGPRAAVTRQRAGALPVPPTAFLGRERELAEVLMRLRDGARVVTLTGPGGTGKTRLALEAAATVGTDYDDGVFWVGLAALRDPALVVESIAHAVGAKGDLLEHIGMKKVLLLLDNFEHVVAAAPELSGLVRLCPNARLLVTSRELLRVAGEVEFAVPPLLESEAVELFCARVRTERSDDIRRLCARLDNLPLAVELAAARTKALTPRQILERLAQRLDLLKGGRDADPRQQTLRATIEWSYDLLGEKEQRLFQALSVFAGGCTLEAAEQVAEADVDTLQSLVEKSLLRFANERYSMLQTIHEYAEERASEATDSAELRRRHRAWFVALAKEHGIDVLNPDPNKLLSSKADAATMGVTADFANIRQAVAHALSSREPDDVAHIVTPLFSTLIVQGHVAEAREWVEAALAQRDDLSRPALAEILVGGGEIMRFAGHSTRAAELKLEALALVDEVREFAGWTPFVVADLCDIALENGDFELAREYAARSAATGGGIRAVASLAEVCLRAGDLESAQSHGRVALAGLDEGEINYAACLELLGEIARRRGDDAEAERRFSDGLRSHSALEDGGGVADCLDGLSRLAFKAGDAERAGRLRGASQNLRHAWGRLPSRTDIAWPRLPEDALLRGSAMSLREAVNYALASGTQGAADDLHALTESVPPPEADSNTNLPRPASSFVGRERELGDVLARFGQGARLVTLTGPGGSGKTRLAIEAAATLVPEIKAGVFWIGMGALRDPALVTETIMQTLGAKDGLAEHIGERELLLLVDNFEQVIDAAPELSTLVRACPKLRLLVTSRELLRVEGEVEYPVPPLAEPEAIALFCARAQTKPSDEIRDLCARLDNLPLAVELAAARTKALTPMQILERLSQRPDLLKGGRDADPRQQTLRATIEWSYDLLSEDEQRLFRALSVFAGGCTLDAAEHVADADLDTLQSLVEKSLVRFAEERYWMLETIQEYAGERLQDRGHSDLGQRHAEYFLALVEHEEPELVASRQLASIARLTAEHDNLRAARTWFRSTNDGEREIRLVAAVWGFLMARGHLSEGRTWLEEALAARDAGTLERRATALFGAAILAIWQGDHARGQEYAEESLTLAREHGDKRSVARALDALALAAQREGDDDRAASLFQECRELARDVGDEWLLGIALNNLGDLALNRGSYSEAGTLFEESLALGRKHDNSERIARSLVNLASVHLELGQDETALALLEECLDRAVGAGFVEVVESALEGFAALAATKGDAERAVTLVAQAEELRNAIGVSLVRFEQSRNERLLLAARQQLGPDAFTEARRRGQALSMTQAVDFALGRSELTA
jgi:predicted ATPase/predicted Ser/Thr protein kinase